MEINLSLRGPMRKATADPSASVAAATFVQDDNSSVFEHPDGCVE